MTKWTETSPSAAAISAQSPTRPICPALRSAIAASPAFLHFSMPILHGLRRHGLAVAELAVDHRQRRRIDNEVSRLVRNHGAHLLPADIDRHPDHAVAVMAGEVGGREVGRDAPGFLGRKIPNGKNLCNEVDQVVDLYGDHIRISALSLHGEACVFSGGPKTPAPVCMTGLAGTLSEKSRACLPPSVALDK